MAIGTTAAILGMGAVSAGVQAISANRAAKAQENSAQMQADVQERMYRESVNALRRYRKVGRRANNAVGYELGLIDKPKGYRGYERTPGYRFNKRQGISAIDASAAANGTIRSGAHELALQRFGSGLAAQDYGNHLNRLMGVQNMGQNSAVMQGSMGQNYANSLSNALANMGNAQSAGAIATGNAIAGGINNLSSALMYKDMMGAA